jgi:hypothetical protein
LGGCHEGLAYIATGFTAALAVAALEFLVGGSVLQDGLVVVQSAGSASGSGVRCLTARETGVKVAGLIH